LLIVVKNTKSWQFSLIVQEGLVAVVLILKPLVRIPQTGHRLERIERLALAPSGGARCLGVGLGLRWLRSLNSELVDLSTVVVVLAPLEVAVELLALVVLVLEIIVNSLGVELIGIEAEVLRLNFGLGLHRVHRHELYVLLGLVQGQAVLAAVEDALPSLTLLRGVHDFGWRKRTGLLIVEVQLLSGGRSHEILERRMRSSWEVESVIGRGVAHGSWDD